MKDASMSFGALQGVARGTGLRPDQVWRILALLVATLVMSVCAMPDKPNIKVDRGPVLAVKYVGGLYISMQIDTVTRILLIKGYAPLPLRTEVELRSRGSSVVLLCEKDSGRCWKTDQKGGQ